MLQLIQRSQTLTILWLKLSKEEMKLAVMTVVEEETESEDSPEIESGMIYRSNQNQNRAYQIVDKYHKSKEMMIERKDLVILLGKGGRFLRNLKGSNTW